MNSSSRSAPKNAPDGFLLIDKENGPTSFDIIRALKKEWSSRSPGIHPPKLGHTGTLDPFASGLMIICVGEGVKFSSALLHQDKTYQATLRFGIQTESGDPTTPIIRRSEAIPENVSRIEQALQDFVKNPYWQTPPMHSAIKQDGVRLYKLARQGLDVPRKASLRIIHDFLIHSFSPPDLDFSVRCSSGTYIRTLGEDLAKKLDSTGSLTALSRTTIGKLRLENALPLDACTPPWTGNKNWIPLVEMAERILPCLEVCEEDALALRQGRQEVLAQLRGSLTGMETGALTCKHTLVATFSRVEGVISLERVYHAS